LADVFISYKTERRNAAQHLSRVLELNAYSVWFDYGLLSGRDFGPQIEREIRAAKSVIVLWCSLSRDSRWVLEEAHLAERLGTLTPVWLEYVEPPLGFGRAETIDLSTWDGAPRSPQLNGLLNEIARRVGREPAPSYRGLSEYEQTWRRFGAPTLSRFALIDPLAHEEEQRILNGEHRGEEWPDPPIPSRRISRRAIVGGSVAGVAVAGIALTVEEVLRRSITSAPLSHHSQSPAAAPTLLRTLNGDAEEVQSVVFAPGGKTLASSGDDHTIKLWDPTSGQLLHTLTGHSGWVKSVIFSPDGRILASGSFDTTIKLWDPASGQLLRTLIGETETVRSVAFSPDGKTLASGSWAFVRGPNRSSGRIRLWDAATGQVLRILGTSSESQSVAFSPDGRMLISNSTDESSAGGNTLVKLWDLPGGGLLRTFGSGIAGGVDCLTSSPDGRILASGHDDGAVRLWELASGQPTHTLSGHSGRVSSIAFSPNGQVLASGSWDLTIRLWDITNYQLLATMVGQPAAVLSISFAPDGRVLAAGADTKIGLWDVLPLTITGQRSAPPVQVAWTDRDVLAAV
jgi:hypothetical protein